MTRINQTLKQAFPKLMQGWFMVRKMFELMLKSLQCLKIIIQRKSGDNCNRIHNQLKDIFHARFCKFTQINIFFIWTLMYWRPWVFYAPRIAISLLPHYHLLCTIFIENQHLNSNAQSINNNYLKKKTRMSLYIYLYIFLIDQFDYCTDLLYGQPFVIPQFTKKFYNG